MSKAGLYKPALESFWSVAQEELMRFGIEEELIRVAEMQFEMLRSFGPIETSILVLAKRLGAVVLTDDSRLRNECGRHEIRVLSCGEVLATWQQYQV